MIREKGTARGRAALRRAISSVTRTAAGAVRRGSRTPGWPRPVTAFARLLVVAALAAPWSESAAPAEPGVAVVERESFGPGRILGRPPAGADASHELRLTLVELEGAGWQRDEVLDVVSRAGEVIARCGVRVVAATRLRVAAPPEYRYFHTPLSRVLARALRPARPTVYFVADTRQQPAFDAEAIGRGNSRTRPELADSVWLTRPAQDPGIALAHELFHVLTNSGEHVQTPGNLMRDRTSPANVRLEELQCLRLRRVGAMLGLLHEATPSARRPADAHTDDGGAR